MWKLHEVKINSCCACIQTLGRHNANGIEISMVNIIQEDVYLRKEGNDNNKLKIYFYGDLTRNESTKWPFCLAEIT